MPEPSPKKTDTPVTASLKRIAAKLEAVAEIQAATAQHQAETAVKLQDAVQRLAARAAQTEGA